MELLPKATFVGVVYTSKEHGETARYTMNLNVRYTELLKKNITECEIQLQNENLSDTDRIAWAEMKHSFEKSLEYQSRGEQNPDYTKKGQYWRMGNGIQMNLNDRTLEISGIQHSRKVLEKGTYKAKNYRNDITRKKDEIRKILPKWRTLSIDEGTLHSVQINGDCVELGVEK